MQLSGTQDIALELLTEFVYSVLIVLYAYTCQQCIFVLYVFTVTTDGMITAKVIIINFLTCETNTNLSFLVNLLHVLLPQ